MKLDKMLTAPVKASVISFAIALAAALDARSEVATNVWIGAENSSLEWNSAANWSLGHKPEASEHILITNKTAQAITTSSYTMRIARLTVSGANHSLSATGFYYDAYTGEDKDSLPAGTIIEVESGRTLSIGTNGRSSADDKTIVNKLGGGTIYNSGGMGTNGNESYYRYKAINVYGGKLQMVTPNREVHASRILIADGATFDMGGEANKLWSGCEVEVQAGGTFNCQLDNRIARLSGAGAVTGNGILTLSLADGPCGFAGTLNKSIIFNVTEYVPGVTEFICSNATIMLNRKYSAAEGTMLANVFKVSKDLGRVGVAIEFEPERELKYDDGSAVEYARYIAAGKTYTHTAGGDDHWTDPVFGEGKIVEKSGGTWTIDSLSLTGGTFTVDGATLGTNLVLNGGISTNLVFAAKNGYTVTFGGIDLQTTRALRTYYGWTFIQTAGTIDASPVTSGYNAEQDEREIGYFISGGTLISRPDYGNFSMGLGLEASGDAHVILKNGAKGPHSLIHNAGGTNYCRRLCVRGNALVEVENLKFYYYKGAGAGTTGTVEIAENGVLSLKGSFGSEGDYVPNAGQTVRLEFDGGTLRSDRQGNVDVPSYHNFLPDDMKVAYVREGGACFDVPRTNRAAKLTTYWTVRSDVADGKDGGIRKTGGGLMTFAAPVSTTGPVAIEDGNIVNTRSGSSVLGSGSLVLRDRTSLMMDNTAAAKLAYGTGAQVKFSGNATIRLTKLDVGLELGDESDATVPFVREGRGYLTIMAGNGGGSVGSESGNDFRRRPITLHGGALANASCGILSAPVFGWVWGQTGDSYGHNRGSKDLRFMACNAESGLLDIAHSVQTNAIPAGSDESTLAYFHNNQTVTLSADAKVGAMTVYGGNHRSDAAVSRIGGVSISQGVTLTVGSDDLGCAPIVMDNKYVDTTDYGPAIIGGKGTLDFGAREGLIGLNLTYANSGVRLPARIECTIAGTGGLTVFSPNTRMLVLAKDVNPGFDVDTVRALRLSGENTYGGGTYVDNAIVLPVKATSLGTGAVTLSCKDGIGGALFFDDECTTDEFANDITVAGHGFGYTGSSEAYISRWGLGGAISTLKSLKLTGAVTLTDDATIKVDGEDSVLTLAGGVSGSGKLTVIGTGTLSVGSAISCDGGVDYQVAAVEIRPLDAGELTIPAAQVPAGATIVVDPTGAAVVS